MGLITRTYTYSAGAVIVAANHNTNENTVYNEINGNLTTANLSPSAGLVDTQFATISTAGKVNISALTVGSQATGDIIYASSASAWARLGKGTALQVLRMNSGATLPEWGDQVSAAAQSDQETATSTTTYVSPGRQQYHPCHPKAWCYFNGTTTGTNAPTVGSGVTSVTRNSAGNYTVNLSITLSSANFAVIATPGNAGTGTNVQARANAASTTTATVSSTNTANAEVDCDVMSVVILGDI